MARTDQRTTRNGGRRARRLASGSLIREAAAALFLEKGYQATSMEEIAAAAHISKQTIYTHFADKDALFADLVLGNVDRVEGFVAGLAAAGQEDDDVAACLREVARQYLRFVIQPEILQLRRLVIAEASRFPDLARTYYDRVPERVYRALAELLEQFSARGQLRVTDHTVAAGHFAWLLLGRSLDHAMFYGTDEIPSATELEQLADGAVGVFLAAYGTGT